jgi:hypothetical protein
VLSVEDVIFSAEYLRGVYEAQDIEGDKVSEEPS